MGSGSIKALESIMVLKASDMDINKIAVNFTYLRQDYVRKYCPANFS